MSEEVIGAVREAFGSSDRAFWLDGGGARSWLGRRSMVGVLGPDDVSLSFDAATGEVTRHQSGRTEVIGQEIFGVLREEIARDQGDPDVHWVGYFGYASRADLPARAWGRGPDAVWMRCTDVAFFDHPDDPPPTARHNPRGAAGPLPQWYRDAYGHVQEALRAGNSYEVNLTYRDWPEPAANVDPLTAYLRLRAVNPAPYAGLLQHQGVHLLSSSPERYATVGPDRWIETKPIKGTTPRAVSRREDEALRVQLSTDPKFRGENLMIVDLLRNDLSMVCDPGTVSVPSLMAVESYTSVHQLVSTVRGRLQSEVDTVGALWALFPAGSMTGAPKLRTMSIIDGVESSPRGIYSGAFGWINADGRADLGVVIRSLMHTSHGWELGTGGGVTVRSDVLEEWEETRWKAARLTAALDL